MKKNYFLIAIVLLVTVLITLTSCSKRENPVAPEKEEPKAEGLFGTLKVVTIPNSAVVIFDNKNYGPSPVNIDSLAPAPYTYKILSPDSTHADSGEAFYEVKVGLNNLMVQLKKIGTSPVDTVFVVIDTSRVDTVITPPDTVIVIQDTTITDTLIVVEPPDTTKPSYGWLVVNHNETTAGAGVYVDGGFVGWLGYPEFRDTLIVGWHNLKVSKEGYQDFSTLFQIDANKPTVFNPTLVPLASPTPDSTGNLTLLLVWPNSVSYEVKGQSKTWTGNLQKNVPVHIDGIAAGDYTVSASTDGYLGFLETRKVGPGNWTHDFRIQLDPESPTPPPPPPTKSKKVVSWDASPEDATLRFDGALYSLHETRVEVDSGSVHQLVVTVGSCWSAFDSTFTVRQNMHFDISLSRARFESNGNSISVTKFYLDQNGFTGMVFDGSSHDLFYVNKREMIQTAPGSFGSYVFVLNQLPYRDYNKVTFYKQGSWFSTGLHCVPDTARIWLVDDEWFGFKWNGREIPLPAPTYHLTVNSGYGDGDYVAGTVVNIYADAPQSGYHFVKWVGDVQYVANPSQNETSVTMSGDVTITATYVVNPPPVVTDSWVDLRVNPNNCTIHMNGQLWGEGVSWISIGSHTVKVEKTGYDTKTKNFTTVAGETTLIEITLAETPPPPPPANPLKVEASGNIVKLLGDGYQNWLGLEMYDPDQNETTGWIVNHWVKGNDKGNYTEFVIPDARLSHGVFWKNATPGLEGSGGKGTHPRFTNWDQLQKGSGISQINTSPGYFVRNP